MSVITFPFFNRRCYLGHIISAEGVSTDPSKLEVVANWQSPTTILALQILPWVRELLLLLRGGLCQVGCPSTLPGS